MTGSSAAQAEGSGARLNGGGLSPAGGLYQRLTEHDGVEPAGVARGLVAFSTQVHVFGGTGGLKGSWRPRVE